MEVQNEGKKKVFFLSFFPTLCCYEDIYIYGKEKKGQKMEEVNEYWRA